MADTVYIYALVDPRTEEVRYIGKTKCASTRLRAHLYVAPKENTHKGRWIAHLLREGLAPKFTILEEIPEEHWQQAERRQIALQREIGARLTNATDGGGGTRNLSLEARAKISAASRKQIHSPERRAKVAAANRARSPEIWARVAEKTRARPPISEETREKMSIAQKSRNPATRKMSLETKAKISAAKQGHSVSPEARAKMSAARRMQAPASPETRAKLSASGKARWTPEARTKMADIHQGNKHALGYRHTSETRARISASANAFWANKRELESALLACLPPNPL